MKNRPRLLLVFSYLQLFGRFHTKILKKCESVFEIGAKSLNEILNTF